MHVRIEIPDDAEAVLRKEWGDLDKAAKEALLIESYRAGKVSLGFLSKTLAISRWEVEAWLAKRGVHWNYSLEDLEADRATLRALQSP